jgi:hypothetical protein
LLAVDWESAENDESASGVSTDSLSPDVFASTIQAGVLGTDPPVDELDEAEIERSIREINDAIKRSAQKKK